MNTEGSLGSIGEDAGNGSGSDLDVVRAQFDDWRSRHPKPRWSPQNRPYMVGVKTGHIDRPGLDGFYAPSSLLSITI